MTQTLASIFSRREERRARAEGTEGTQEGAMGLLALSSHPSTLEAEAGAW